jgi:NADH-ubiquinone oxidoreductase chain 6
MLIDIRTSELQISNWNSIPLASFIVIFLNIALTEGLPLMKNSFNNIREVILFGSKNFNENYINKLSIKSLEISQVTSNTWDGNITETSHISSIGNILYTSYNMWLFITGFILLLAMVGAIVITIKK